MKGENFDTCEGSEIIESLLKEGIEIKKVILGGMGAKNAGRPLTGMCRQAVRRLNALNGLWKGEGNLYQLVPNDKAVNIRSLF